MAACCSGRGRAAPVWRSYLTPARCWRWTWPARNTRGRPTACSPGALKQSAHQGAVTSVRLTPDGRLASAGRDNVLKLWALAAGGATLVKAWPGRTGDVHHLDVQPGTGAICFDHGDELRLLDPHG